MKRTILIVVLAALMVLPSGVPVMGSGGNNPPPAAGLKFTGPAVSASIVIDPHMPGVTWDQRGTAPQVVEKGGWVSIRLRKGTSFAGAIFRVPNPTSFPLKIGCVPGPLPEDSLGISAGTDLTKLRFVTLTPNEPKLLTAWIPAAIVDALFLQLGIPVAGDNIPVITDVENAVCTPDPYNPAPVNPDSSWGDTAPGMLSFEAVIQFVVPYNK